MRCRQTLGLLDDIFTFHLLSGFHLFAGFYLFAAYFLGKSYANSATKEKGNQFKISILCVIRFEMTLRQVFHARSDERMRESNDLNVERK